MVEKPLQRAGIAGGDADRLVTGENLGEAGILPRGHFTEVRDALEGDPGLTEALEDGVFRGLGHGVGEGTTAIENLGRQVAQNGKR